MAYREASLTVNFDTLMTRVRREELQGSSRNASMPNTDPTIDSKWCVLGAEEFDMVPRVSVYHCLCVPTGRHLSALSSWISIS
jgi:hypothetical protein